ncbi:MAG: VanZ family protein [Myxococcales bacterium]
MAWARLSRLARYWLPLAAYAGTIFVLSAMSRPPIPSVNLPYFDKVLHFGEYAGLGLLLCRALTMGDRGLAPRSAFAAAALLCALYGVSDEVHQMFVPQREADALDLLADVAGAASGAGLYALFVGRRRTATT